eukprot:scaffold11792_cov112-Isochrysis_galbana.AAC.1
MCHAPSANRLNTIKSLCIAAAIAGSYSSSMLAARWAGSVAVPTKNRPAARQSKLRPCAACVMNVTRRCWRIDTILASRNMGRTSPRVPKATKRQTLSARDVNRCTACEQFGRARGLAASVGPVSAAQSR